MFTVCKFQPEFTLCQELPDYTLLNMKNGLIIEVTYHKHLGLILWWSLLQEYYDYIKTKTWIRINVMGKLKF